MMGIIPARALVRRLPLAALAALAALAVCLGALFARLAPTRCAAWVEEGVWLAGLPGTLGQPAATVQPSRIPAQQAHTNTQRETHTHAHAHATAASLLAVPGLDGEHSSTGLDHGLRVPPRPRSSCGQAFFLQATVGSPDQQFLARLAHTPKSASLVCNPPPLGSFSRVPGLGRATGAADVEDDGLAG
ncbi:hypothetical protein BD289DRAFT_265666 [Coniella lustricola]|uniref:Uncharacterized protein n=1 Tax=Coniella lustricola TaxID=2025994 RepID=A0A2T3A797_9PEZI|nr:hypothetical protein BD289DRAFT_265666 [Coniella lustricola]